ncbi:MAG: PD-(D/E)XK nuclease family protein [Candidatus Peribacteraceae bacterium]|nr:PD-(D/E)XK nuclease family protein [Candidatus Peribacteraceae bacterium]
MDISITKISTFLDCPRIYWYRYELKLQTPKSEGFYFGSAIHEGLENYYNGKDPMQGVKNALFGKKKKLAEQPKEGIDLNRLHKEARRIFQMYPSQAPYFKPVLVEHFFRVPLIHPETKERLPAMLTGKMDLITASADVVDHKTASGEDTGYFKKKNELQGNGYSYAYLQMFGNLPRRFIINPIIKGNSRREPRMGQPKILKPQIGDVCMFFDTAKYVVDAILRGETKDYPSKNHYRLCPFKDICSYCQRR